VRASEEGAVAEDEPEEGLVREVDSDEAMYVEHTMREINITSVCV
jgi:hypothetical protein